ncbi:N-acetyltransferase [Mesobacillus boroniphilus]|uniref:N-acetyltransferase n=1 Tax=Mesobacillus boroniphilus TaxID=308892 RepID=A0A944CP05_9BACI|nr:GNAT family N-acetyltransferase [Mesobacillus boroniphilus]MBS8266505.1 N-acetyltransferase [Mesobacillus boroniphilus]
MKKYNEGLELVELNPSDTWGLVMLSASVGWDYDEEEIGTLFSSSSKVFGHKNFEGKLVSSAAIIPYDKKLASIGVVIVDNDYRGLGLGKEVTQKCIDSARDRSIMLIATAEGKPLYEKLGFTVVDSVHKYLCGEYNPPYLEPLSGITVEAFNKEHLEDMIKLDGPAFGDMRTSFLRNRIQQASQSIVVKDQDSKIIGYGLSILGPVNLILGPVVAPDYRIAQIIIDRLACHHQGKLRVDVPSGHEKLMTFLEQSGFIKVNNPPVMAIHTDKMPTRNHTLFTIASQAYG